MIETGRLRLRRWGEADVAPFHAMCSDPAVMEFLGPLQSLDDVAAMIDRQNGFLDSYGSCFLAVERMEDGAFLGFCGIKPGALGTPVEGRPEIGWRFARPCWGLGYAREAAEACLGRGFATLPDDSIWAITVPGNVRSWGLMERLGMKRQAHLDFDHPLPGLEARLKPHITYSIARPAD